MRIVYLVFLILIISHNVNAQIEFEKGYFIKKNGEKINCLIKNEDWKYNPTEFRYKLTKNGTIQKGTIKGVRAFSILNFSKYILFTGKIDHSGDRIDNLNYEKEPNFKEGTFFLKYLVEGNANLFYYNDGHKKRYFYSLNDGAIQQLVYKKYLDTASRSKENLQYKNQLWKDLKCQNVTIQDSEQLVYNSKSLIEYFVKYNTCTNTSFINFAPMGSKSKLNLSLRPGVNYASLSIDNPISQEKSTDFGKKVSFRVGVELEYFFPFRKNKWAMVLEPTFQFFRAENQLSNQSVKANYQSIELPIGFKYYFLQKRKAKLYSNAAFVFDMGLGAKIEFEKANDLDLKKGKNIRIGVGTLFQEKYNLEVQYSFRRNILANYASWNADYTYLSLLFSYRW